MLKKLWTFITHSIKKGVDYLLIVVTNQSLLFRTLRPFLILFAITAISYLAVDIVFKIVGLTFSTRSASVKSNAFTWRAVRTSRPESASDYEIIAQRNLFLTTQKATTDKSTEGFFSNGEEYSAFDLKGTIAVDNDFGFVVVEEKAGGKQKLYRIGEMIGSAKLVRISRNAAIFNSGGRELVMRTRETADASPMTRSSRFGSDQAQSGIVMSRQEVTDSPGNLKSIMSQAVVQPFLNAGVHEGYIISNIAPGSLYERVGLQNGDIIIDVNGKSFGKAVDLLQLVNLMQSGGNISLNLIRYGKSETINYSFH
jgi:general secretion pathway protein C